MLPTPKNAPARRFGDAMAASSRKGSGMGTPSLKLNTYRWKLPEKWYQVARSLGKSPKKSSEIDNTPPYLRPRLEPFLQGKSATLQKYQKGVFMVQSLKNLQNKQPRTGAFFCKPFRNLQGKFESFLLLTAEKKGSVRAQCDDSMRARWERACRP